VALKPLRKPAVVKKPPVFKPWTPPKPPKAPVLTRQQVAPRSTTAGLTPYTGYTGPGVQDLINQGTIGWDPANLANLGYTPPPNWGFGGGGGGAGGPDYGSMISGDWEVQDAEAAHGAQMARARGDFQAGLRSQLIDLGLTDVSKLGSLGQYIDQDTITKAIENKYSATAQIGQQAERGRAQNNAALAARGLLSSGQTTKSQQDVSAAAESGRYSALRSFLEGGASGLSGLADMEYQGARGIAAARQAAAMRAADLYQGDYSEGPAAPAAAGGYDYTGYATPRSGMTPAKLSRQQFLQRRPGGQYANYLQAYRRHALGR
jgi:hypothetical protein